MDELKYHMVKWEDICCLLTLLRQQRVQTQPKGQKSTTSFYKTVMKAQALTTTSRKQVQSKTKSNKATPCTTLKLELLHNNQ